MAKYLLVNVLTKQSKKADKPETVTVTFDKYPTQDAAIKEMEKRCNRLIKESERDSMNKLIHSGKVVTEPKWKYTEDWYDNSVNTKQLVSRGWPKKTTTFSVFSVPENSDGDMEMYLGINNFMCTIKGVEPKLGCLERIFELFKAQGIEINPAYEGWLKGVCLKGDLACPSN